jgi:hypothetical protein
MRYTLPGAIDPVGIFSDFLVSIGVLAALIARTATQHQSVTAWTTAV